MAKIKDLKCPVCGDSMHMGYDMKIVTNLYNSYHCDSNNNCAIVLIPTGKYDNSIATKERNETGPDPENNDINLYSDFSQS